ncbi:MAG: hypothetical protein WDN49_10125 [Acetobacteraceae bacterium]
MSLGRQDEARDLVDSLFESHGVARRLGFERNLAVTACGLVAGGAGGGAGGRTLAAVLRRRCGRAADPSDGPVPDRYA